MITYGNSLPNDFAFDDNLLLVNNTAVHGFSADNLRDVLGSVPNGVEYLPVRDLTYMLDYSIWKLDPRGYHLSNVIYYALACWALYLFLAEFLPGRLRDARLIAFLAAAIFVVHPVHVEAVAGISQRKDLVSAIFLFLCLYAYLAFLRKRNTGFYLGALGFCFLSLLSKHTAVVLPVLMTMLDFLYVRHTDVREESPSRKVLRLAPFFAIAAAIVLVNLYIMGEAGIFRKPLQGGLWIRIDFAARAVYRYLALLVVPYPLTVRHTFNHTDVLFAVPFPVVIAGIAAGFCMIVLWREKRRILSFAAAWFLVALAPSLMFASSHYVVCERYLFLPSAGYCLLAGHIAGASRFLENPRARWAAAVLPALVFLAFLGLSVNRNPHWKNDITLFTAALRNDPENPDLYYFLGRAYFDQGMYVEAFSNFGAGRDFAPYLPDYGFYQALYSYRKGEYEEALKTLRETSSRMNMDITDIHYLYGRTYEKLGRMEEARDSYRKAADSDMSIASFYFTKTQSKAALDALLRGKGGDIRSFLRVRLAACALRRERPGLNACPAPHTMRNPSRG